MKLTKRQKAKLIGLLFALMLFGLNTFTNRQNKNIPNQTAVTSPVSAGYYKVTQFDDGDTIAVDMNGSKETIRMIGVDTPEVKDPRKPVQCFGKSASEFTKQLIGNNSVRLEADPLNTNRDRYNRLLRYVYLPDGRLVNAEIIKQGYGFAYTSFPFSKIDEFKGYQKSAREQNLGLWNKCQPQENSYGGMTSNPE